MLLLIPLATTSATVINASIAAIFTKTKATTINFTTTTSTAATKTKGIKVKSLGKIETVWN